MADTAAGPGQHLERVLREVFHRASRLRHEYVTVEHLLLGLTDDPDARRVLVACQADLDQLQKDLSAFLAKHVEAGPEGVALQIQPTLGVQRVLSRAAVHIGHSGRDYFNGADVLVAMFSEEESYAVYCLSRQGIERLDAITFLSHGNGEESGQTREEKSAEESAGAASAKASQSALQFTRDLNKEAEQGLIDPLIGRADELERMMQVLCRRRKNNPLLVGEAGVGKTAIAEGLARAIVEERVPGPLQDSTVHALDMGAILAGTRYRGDFEKRFKSLMQELSKTGQAILFIDEIHTIIGAGAASSTVLDASNMLKPLLSAGRVRCIGATTYQEYRGIFDRDRALSRRFQKIDISEPGVTDTYRILKGLRSRYEEHHGLRYTDRALRAAAELAGRHLTERFMPDKAIDVIDEAGARSRLSGGRKRRIGVGDIEGVVAKMARIPPRSVTLSDQERLRNLESSLQLKVFGQNQAISALASAIKLARSGLKPQEKPVGSYLFAGPTGVGKTEVCRQLAAILGVELIRFDMSEYQERHTVSRLIGAPPGYVGYDQGGLLTEAVARNPHSVVLLDEIEKAHPDVYNLLLQIMDHGTLTDNNGRKSDFRNVILIMTSNAGAADAARRSMGFTEQDHRTDAMTSIERLFTPEFRNRLDAIILFQSLNESVAATVADKFIAELQSQLDERKVQLHLDDEVRRWLVAKGYDRTMGARPMERVIQEHIKRPLAELLLFGDLATGGGAVRVRVKGDTLQLELEEEESPDAGNPSARNRQRGEKEKA